MIGVRPHAESAAGGVVVIFLRFAEGFDARFAQAVAASAHHANAGFMARREELQAGVGDMASDYRPGTYGEQLWNYFSRSYPEIVDHHYGVAPAGARP